MGRTTILLSFFIMPFIVSTYAQKAKGYPLQWKIAAELPSLNGKARSLGFAGPVAGVHENRLFIGGGANFPDSMPWQGGKKKYYDDLYVFTKDKETITLHPKTFKLPFRVAYAASCTTPQGIVYAGGENENGISNYVFLLKWDADRQTVSTKNLPDLPHALTNAAAAYYDNRIYIAGGETTSSVSNGFYVLDLDSNETGWQQLPILPGSLSHAVMVVPGAEAAAIYLVGGRRRNANGISDLLRSVFRFDIKKKQWEEIRSLPFALSAGSGITVNDGNFLLLGGDKGETFHQTEKLIAAINREKDEIKKLKLVRQKNLLQSAHPGFSKEIWMYNRVKDEWTKAGCIPFDSPVTTTAVIWNDKIILPSGEIRAGIRTPQILSADLYSKGK